MRTLVSMLVSLFLVSTPLTAVALMQAFPTPARMNATEYNAKLLPELKGVVSWRTLAKVELVKDGDKLTPSFNDQVMQLDQQNVRIYGFMIPLGMTDRQKHFLLSAAPPSCPYCMPAGPEATVEVMSDEAVKYGFDAMIMSGKLTVLKNDRNGLFYRISDAKHIDLPSKN